MVPQSKKDELLVSWRALADHGDGEGWSIIPVSTEIRCRVLAGRHYPGNEEAILFGFSSIRIPPADQLPQGHGFLVSKVEPCDILGQSSTWIALSRQRSGSLDLFVTMADDVILTLDGLKHINDEGLFQVFLGRIRAWQSFMHREQTGLLSAENEVGLFGELELLRSLLLSGVPDIIALEGWQGPFEGIHDFSFGSGAIEVKTTLSPACFPAQVNSLEQFDDSLVQSLFVAGIRLKLDSSGFTLPEQIDELRRVYIKAPEALAMFDSALINVGFLVTASSRYERRFLFSERKMMRIADKFPRLTRKDVKIEISKVKYELDLDMVAGCDVEFSEVLKQLKII
jgi:hypothetical protein